MRYANQPEQGRYSSERNYAGQEGLIDRGDSCVVVTREVRTSQTGSQAGAWEPVHIHQKQPTTTTEVSYSRARL